MPALPGAAQSLPQQRRLGEGPGECVLAPAAADQQDLHALLRRCSGARARRESLPTGGALPYGLPHGHVPPPRRPGPARQPARLRRVRDRRRHQAHPEGRLRPGARARGDHRAQALPLRPRVSLAEGRGREAGSGGVEDQRAAPRHPAGERAGGARHRAHRHLRRPFQVPARHRPAGLRRRGRAARPDRAAAAAPARGGALRRRAQAADPAAAARHRRRHQRARRGDPGHPHHRRPALSAAHPPLARPRAGPRRGGADRGRHRGLRRPAARTGRCRARTC